MQCQIVSIGDELLLGDTVNTNASWLGNFLAEHGVRVTKIYTIQDTAAEIKRSIEDGLRNADLVITTGGLGPTHDDVTKKTVAELFNSRMIIHQPTLDFIKKVFKKRNLPFSKSNYFQAEVPDNCKVMFNKQGTAPGLWFEREGHHLAVLPGVPHEVKSLAKNELLPRIKEFTNGIDRIFSHHIKVAGIGESTLSDKVLGSLDEFLSDDIAVAFLPSPEANTIRINTRAASPDEADKKNKAIKEYVYKQAGKYIIGEGKDLTLSEAIGKVLSDHSLTISVAESCTGGLLANTLTDTPGSSNYMVGGIIAYANRIKMNQLAISKNILNTHGAVSKPVVLQMAKGIARLMATDIGISTTGIAGPGGGTEDKPVGMVWIGFWSKNHHFALKTFFTNDRRLNKKRSVAVALETARRAILGIDPMPYDLKPHSA